MGDLGDDPLPLRDRIAFALGQVLFYVILAHFLVAVVGRLHGGG